MITRQDQRYFIYKHLLSYIPYDISEERSKKKLLQLLENCATCFERENMPGHITGSALLVDEDLKYALLTHHKKVDKWLQFGGHADGDSNPLRVALKETIEESGIDSVRFLYPYSGIFDVDVHEINKFKEIPVHFHYDIRILLIADKGEQYIVSDESKALKWIKLEEVKKYNNQPNILRLIEKVKKIKKYNDK